jgi:hypothetical protein
MDEALHVVSWHGGLAWRTMHSSQMYQQEARALHNLRQAAVQRGYGPSCSGDSFFVAAPATKEAGAQRGCRLPRWSAHSAAKGLSALLGPRGNGSSRRGLADGDAPPPLSTTGPRWISAGAGGGYSQGKLTTAREEDGKVYLQRFCKPASNYYNSVQA